MARRIRPLLEAIALATWGALILSLAAAGRLDKVVNVRSASVRLLTLGGGGALTLLALARTREVFRRTRAAPCCTAGPGSARRSLGILAPALVGLVLGPRAFGLTALRSAELSAGPAAVELLGFGSEGRPPFYAPTNLLAVAYASARDPFSHLDRPVEVEGIRQEVAGAPRSLYRVGRFVMTCCAADAYPIAATVVDDTGSAPPEGRWVLVRGTLQWDRGGQALVILADCVLEIPEPASPYLSPDDREAGFLYDQGVKAEGGTASGTGDLP